MEKIADISTAQMEQTYRVNVFGLFWLCKAVLPLMPPGGSIIATASIQATHPSPSLLDYAPTKASILAFTRALARQVAEAAYGNGMTEDRIERALEDDYLSRDPSPSKRAAYIRRTMEKARRWVER